jgi:hypothetical protein
MLASRRISAVSFGPRQAAGVSSAIPIIGNSPTFAEAQSAGKEYKLKPAARRSDGMKAKSIHSHSRRRKLVGSALN